MAKSTNVNCSTFLVSALRNDLTLSAAASRQWKKKVSGVYRANHHETKEQQEIIRRYVRKAPFPDITAVQGVSSLSGDSKTAHHSPACRKLLETEGDTHTIVVLNTAWPWASEAYGLCRLRA